MWYRTGSGGTSHKRLTMYGETRGFQETKRDPRRRAFCFPQNKQESKQPLHSWNFHQDKGVLLFGAVFQKDSDIENGSTTTVEAQGKCVNEQQAGSSRQQTKENQRQG